MRNPICIAVSMAAALACGAALAQPGSGISRGPSALKYAEHFTQVDRDGDGWIDRNEAARRPDLDRVFDTVDANKDGLVDNAEFSVYEADPTAEPTLTPDRYNSPGQ